MHIEKTGGTSITEMLSKYFSEDEICPERYNHFRHWRKEDLLKYKFFSAHADIENINAIPDPKTCLLILRNPVDRALSFYEFLRYHDSQVQHSDPRIKVAQSLDVEQFFQEAPQAVLECFSNYMTAQLSTGRWPIGRKALKLAISNLDAFAHVGISEDLPGFFVRVFGELGLQSPQNITHSKRTAPLLPVGHPLKLATISDKTLQRIDELNEFDIALYDHVIATYCGGYPLPPEQVQLDLLPMVRTVPSGRGPDLSLADHYEGTVAYGPYKRLTAGEWLVSFSLAADGLLAGAVGEVATLDIFSHSLGGVLVSRSVTGGELASDVLTEIEIFFQLPTTVSDLEFRIHKKGGCRLFWRSQVDLIKKT